MLATAHIADAAQIISLYSPGGVNMQPPSTKGSLDVCELTLNGSSWMTTCAGFDAGDILIWSL